MPEEQNLALVSQCEQAKVVAFQFTRFLIENLLITKRRIKIARTELLKCFGQFQAKHPSYVQIEDIVKALNTNHLLVRRKNSKDAESEIIEFKEIVFSFTSENQVNVDEIIKPRVRVFINETNMFKNKTSKEIAISGLYCRICKVTCADKEELTEHETTQMHKFREMYRTSKKNFTESIDGLIVYKIIGVLERNEEKTYELRISNVSDKSYCILNIHRLVSLDEVTTESFSKKSLLSGEEFVYKVSVNFTHYGTYELPLVLVMQNKLDLTVFNLLSVQSFRVMREDVYDLGPIEPYQPLSKNPLVFRDLPVVSSIPLQYGKLSYVVPLLYYEMPPALIKIMNCGFKMSPKLYQKEVDLLLTLKTLYCGSGDNILPNVVALTENSYCKRFQTMLHIEEYQQTRNIQLFNRNDVELVTSRMHRRLYGLQVPGLSEGRPSILRGDKVYIKFPDNEYKYEGVVYVVEENMTYLSFNESFCYVAKKKVSVEFILNRVNLRMCHRAMDETQRFGLFSFMFPTKKLLDVRQIAEITRFRNRQIENNERQMLAIRNIVRNTAFPAPYIIYGPPGTGKTSTMVEAICQLYDINPGVRICACAPSNFAANLIASRLINHIPQSAILRLYGFSCSPEYVPDELIGCSNFDKSKGDFHFPSVQLIKAKSVVVVTPICAGRVYGYTGGKCFDYLFIDEAGQGEEPLTQVPIVGLLKRNTPSFIAGSVILVGDPKQLGPRIHSKLAIELGLDMSLMERLMKQIKLYGKNDGKYDSDVMTKLTYNYRSHPALLEVPNMLFYNGELEAKANKSEYDWFCGWEGLANPKIPLIFHGVRGKDDRESNSPSYFNQDEISRIGIYLEDLIGQKVKGRTIQQEDIVILTPYRKQVSKVRQYLTKKRWEKVCISSVEMFQGQEKPIVILSTVRSRKEFIANDYQFGLGFLASSKRFNVAITRAKALMIIVGNPDVLQCDPDWRRLIAYCRENGCYKGVLPEGDVSETLDPASLLSLDLSRLAVVSDDIPKSEKPSFNKEE